MAVDDPLDDQASVAVSHQHGIAFERVDQLDDSIDVVVEGGTGLRDGAEAGQGDGMGGEAGGAQAWLNRFPRPRSQPLAGNEDDMNFLDGGDRRKRRFSFDVHGVSSHRSRCHGGDRRARLARRLRVTASYAWLSGPLSTLNRRREDKFGHNQVLGCVTTV